MFLAATRLAVSYFKLVANLGDSFDTSKCFLSHLFFEIGIDGSPQSDRTIVGFEDQMPTSQMGAMLNGFIYAV